LNDFGQIFLRGQVSLSVVPQAGGVLLARLPRNIFGQCSCLPLQNQTIVATTTALAFQNGTFLPPDVCMVRLEISEYVRPDVNQDHLINNLDVAAVQASQFWDQPFCAGACSADCLTVCTNGQCRLPCGRPDVNRDGAVNQADIISITSSGFDVNVACGGVYATDFSCGSSRRFPVVPALGISFDDINYFQTVGQNGGTIPVKRATEKMMDHLMEEITRLDKRDGELASQVSTTSKTRMWFDVFVSMWAVVLSGALVMAIRRK